MALTTVISLLSLTPARAQFTDGGTGLLQMPTVGMRVEGMINGSRGF